MRVDDQMSALTETVTGPGLPTQREYQVAIDSMLYTCGRQSQS